jgi:hypothetical protein
MCGMSNDFHEHMEAGIQPHPVRERYYFHVRPGHGLQSGHRHRLPYRKENCRAGRMPVPGRRKPWLSASCRLASEGKRLPLLGNDDRTADREYIRQFLL